MFCSTNFPKLLYCLFCCLEPTALSTLKLTPQFQTKFPNPFSNPQQIFFKNRIPLSKGQEVNYRRDLSKFEGTVIQVCPVWQPPLDMIMRDIGIIYYLRNLGLFMHQMFGYYFKCNAGWTWLIGYLGKWDDMSQAIQEWIK